MLFNGELSQKVYSYKIEYVKGMGLKWAKVFEATALGELGETLPPNTAPTSEIAVSVSSVLTPYNLFSRVANVYQKPDQRFVIVSNREHSFSASPLHKASPSDSLSTFRIHDNGTLSLVQIAPSGGYLPRQFSLNKKGNRVAVGHQGNSTVVIWERDAKRGKIGEKVGEVKVGGPVVFVGWDE